ncbi:hypothetical protein NDU88_004405 [Pleurodeles waltl]|uniref:Uncharacterized protein n=1 Tax=Pleurodeles waltl TaxID=8319 RepID=A0AAV7WVG1_PLEWA|nr:hypothetical protein NDU88_005696 [Pleurodeles waltl]KAJ1123183.1 hypothetical protein NDU88_001656 [Pleurodeles waltl]KAJ1124171.1 hypothetical protein NDU88_002632 [Pleurodeles waltl]KAJ1124621.1 hypothetical protein NDU88_003070 [Pleurodeles waltl]KAJ1156549.1 hypothetical protein NDU88_009268 [Pleurodeles waltl]
MTSSLRAAGVTGAGPEVPGAKEMPGFLAERARGERGGAAGRAEMVRWVAAVPVMAGGTDGATPAREPPSEDVSVSLQAPVVPVVELPSPSVSLVQSDSVAWPSWAM